ncbi:HflX-like GTP-binding protein, partial [Staphylococcus epidermidis]
KMDEIKCFIELHDIDVVVTNDELTRGQCKRLNDNLGIKMMDRRELILEILGLGGRSREGKVEVEVGEVDYLLGRVDGDGKRVCGVGGGTGRR